MSIRTALLTILASLCSLGALALACAPAAFAESCPNVASRQGPSVNLPQCRVYEQVTPVDKGDAEDLYPSHIGSGNGSVTIDPGSGSYVAEDGEAILVHSASSFTSGATAAGSGYVFSRGSDGWGMSVLEQQADEPQEIEQTELFDPRDLSAVGFEIEIGTYGQLLNGDQSAFQKAYLVGPTGGPYASLDTASGFAALEAGEVEMVGGSEDLSSVILQSKDHSLAPGAESQDEGTNALYEARGGGECGPASSNCKLVDVNEEGKSFECGAKLGQGDSREGGAHTAVSSDGSLVFFTAPNTNQNGDNPADSEGPGCWNTMTEENPPELYMREDGERTVEISKPEAGVALAPANPENPLLPAVFVGASSDGSKVFFMTRTDLTKEAVGHAPELYEYETGSGTLRLISGGEKGTLEGNVNSVTAVSSDGSTVYFTAFKKLAENAKEDARNNQSPFTPVNLYVDHYEAETKTWKPTYITTLNQGDYPAKFGSGSEWYSEEFAGGPEAAVPAVGTEQEGLAFDKEWYTTGDGRFLVFPTIVPLTGFDNEEAPGAECPNSYPQNPANGRCLELYRYDTEAEAHGEPSIVCVSCAGGAPVDGAYFARNATIESPSVGPARPISEDGEDVFFESANALVAQAVPGRDHVYEWHDGVISLISSPSDPGNAFFLGSSADGSNVFFVTHAQLSAQDTDQSADIYDARVDGGFEGITPSLCTGTGCQGVPGAPPIFATPAGVTFEGVGNFPSSEPAVKPASKPKAKPKKCKRGYVKKHGRCMKKKAKRAGRLAKGRK